MTAPPRSLRPTALAAALLSSVLLLLVSVLPSASASASATTTDRKAAAPSAATPVGANGQLRVCGTQWYPHCLTGGSLNALAQDWKADVLRVST
jgi:endoglucanase